MPGDLSSVGARAVDPDGLATRAAATLTVVIGMQTFIIQPGFVQGLVDLAGFSDSQAGYIASAEMFGIAATTVLTAWLSAHVRWRTLVTCSLALVTLGNLLAMQCTALTAFAATRFLVGLGCGVLVSVGYAVTGLSSRPDREFGLLIMWVLIYGALGLLALPSAFALVGFHGVLAILAALPVLGLAALRVLPDGAPRAAGGAARANRVPARTGILLLAAVLCYFLAQGAVWAYLSLIGLASGATEQQVANGLTIAQFLGIAGAFSAATLAPRLRQSTSLVLGILAGVLPMFCFLLAAGALVYGAAVGLFNFAANYITPLLMAVIAGFDRSGRLVFYAVALQMLGLAIGPALAAFVISPGAYGPAVWISAGLFLASLALMLPPVVAHARDLARATPGSAA